MNSTLQVLDNVDGYGQLNVWEWANIAPNELVMRLNNEYDDACIEW